MLAIFNTIGQLVDGLCRDHTIANGLSLKFATSGGLEVYGGGSAVGGGGNLRDLLRCSRHFTHGFTGEKALYTGLTWGTASGGLELFCIQCVVSLGPAGRKNVRCCVLSDYACLLAPSVLRTYVAGSG